MRKTAPLVLALALAACGSDAAGDACVEACSVTDPGTTALVCQLADPCRPHASNDYGLCTCSTATPATCPAGWEPWERSPPPPPPGC